MFNGTKVEDIMKQVQSSGVSCRHCSRLRFVSLLPFTMPWTPNFTLSWHQLQAAIKSASRLQERKAFRWQKCVCVCVYVGVHAGPPTN